MLSNVKITFKQQSLKCYVLSLGVMVSESVANGRVLLLGNTSVQGGLCVWS